MVTCGLGVIVVGERPHVMSVMWMPPIVPADSGYSVIYSELDPEADDDQTPSRVVCLHCLVEDGDEQLARGLDLGRRVRGQVDYDPDRGWFVP